jgi:hypothetical protein
MSNGWYNTAETHRTFGFDLTISVNVASIPISQETFTFNPSDYNHVKMTGGTNQIPTVIGPKNGPQMQFNFTDPETGQSVLAMREIGGIGLREEIGYNIVPSPMIQFSVGTLRNTDLIIRYVPEVQAGDFSTSLFGFGLKHDIKQWIPSIQNAPIDLSLLAAFSGFENRFDMSDMDVQGENQESLFDVNNWTLQGLVSRKISFLTLYGGLGYSSLTSSLKMNGTYEIVDDTNPELPGIVFINPIDICFKEGTVKATVGFRLQLAFFTLHTDYTYQKYHTLTAGFGFSFR